MGHLLPLKGQGVVFLQLLDPQLIDRVVSYVKSTGEVQYSDEVMQKIEENVQEKERKSGSSAPAADPVEDEGAASPGPYPPPGPPRRAGRGCPGCMPPG